MSESQIDKAIADGRVPSDVSKAFLLESKDQPAIAGIIFVAALTFIIVCGRVLSRAFLVRRFGYDDALAVASMMCLIAFVGLCINLINLGSGRHFALIQYVLDVYLVMRTEVLDFAAHIIYTVALLLCRISGLAFYYRICSLHKGFRIAIHVIFGFLIAGFLPQLFLLIFHCHPVTGLWPYGWEPGWERYTCLQWGLVYSVNSSVSLVSDLFLFGIPLAMLRILEMPRKRKIQLACILLPGMGVIGISIARLILVIRGQWEADMSWAYNPMLAVEVSEIGATLIALSIPGIKPIVDKFILRKAIGNTTESGGSTYKNESSRRSKGTALSTFRLRSQHSMLASQENTAQYGTEVVGGARDDTQSQSSTDGIFVRVDFDVKEAQLEEGRRQPGAKHVRY